MSTRFIDTSLITPTSGLPFRGVSLDHLKKGDEDATNAFCKNMIGPSFDPLKKYVISGCINSTPSGPAFTISSGFIFYSGLLFIVDATTFTPAMGETAVCVLNNIYDPIADPTVFTDGSSNNVHVIRKIKIQSGVSGSGLVDFNDLIRAGEIKRRIVGDPGEPVFQNSWQNFFITYDRLSFAYDAQKRIVYFSGVIIKSLYDGNSELIFQLPMDYPIDYPRVFYVWGEQGPLLTSVIKPFRVYVSDANHGIYISSEPLPASPTRHVIYFNNVSLLLD